MPVQSCLLLQRCMQAMGAFRNHIYDTCDTPEAVSKRPRLEDARDSIPRHQQERQPVPEAPGLQQQYYISDSELEFAAKSEEELSFVSEHDTEPELTNAVEVDSTESESGDTSVQPASPVPRPPGTPFFWWDALSDSPSL